MESGHIVTLTCYLQVNCSVTKEQLLKTNHFLSLHSPNELKVRFYGEYKEMIVYALQCAKDIKEQMLYLGARDGTYRIRVVHKEIYDF